MTSLHEITSGAGGRLEQQIAFILEIDRLKTVLRKTKLLHEERFENSAEHSWQLALAAVILAEYANESLDITRVLKMLLIHDLIEIYSGDTFHYDKEADPTLSIREREGARKIFALLPPDQEKELLMLWMEFEEQATAEAQFSTSIDRLMPLLLHASRQDKGAPRVSTTQMLEKNRQIQQGSQELWALAQAVIAGPLTHRTPDISS
jgi:putative hydrolase of HD superfamily